MLIVALMVPSAGPVDVVEASLLVQVSVDLSTSSGTATVNNDQGEVIKFDGHVMVEQPSGVMQTTTMTVITSSDWEASISPEQFSGNNPTTVLISVAVWVPKGIVDGHKETVTVRASSQASILSPSVDSATYEITVKNTSPKPLWVVRILQPANNEVYTTDGLTVSGTASYNLGNITSVEVKVCTSTWQVATGTTNWSIDYDCKYLDDGDHTVYAKARAGEGEVSPTVTIVAVQDRSDADVDPGGGNVVPTDKGEEQGSLNGYILAAGLIIGGTGLAAWAYKRKPSDQLAYLTDHY
jgi:hypothetical protein